MRSQSSRVHANVVGEEPQRRLSSQLEADALLQVPHVGSLRFAVPKSYVLDGLDPHVSRSFERTLQTIAAANATLVDIDLSELNQVPHINRKCGFAAAEAYALHRQWLLARASEYDPRVAVRIARGREQDAADT